MNPVVITYSNRDNAGERNYIKSLEKLGYNYSILGKGEKWEGFMTKIKAYLRYAEESEEEKLLVITDCYDVLAVRGPEVLLTKWKERKSNKPILFSSEVNSGINNCTSLDSYWGEKVRPKNSFLNSGFFMGKARDLVKTLRYAVESKEKDDQMAMCFFADERREEVELDTESKIVGTILIPDAFSYKMEGEKIRRIDTDTYPAFIHIPADHSDLGTRMDYFGKKILGDSYEGVPHWERLRILYNKMSTGSIIVGVIILTFLFYNFRGISITVIITLLLALILFRIWLLR